jgi:predicted transcriptional regulator
MDEQWPQMIQRLIESNAKAIEALGNQSAEDRELIRQVGESVQQVSAAVVRLIDIVQIDRERSSQPRKYYPKSLGSY